jgi:hypothetical protein
MKQTLKIITLLLIFLSLLSCEKDDTETTSRDSYYVKYVIRGNGTYNYFNIFSVKTDLGNQSFSGYQYHSWNQTYGPVERGFIAAVSAQGNVTTEIYVSKNSEPFSLKASNSGSNSASSSYTINF